MIVKTLVDLPQKRPYQIVTFATEGSEYVDCCYRQAELFQHSYTAYLMKSRGAWDKNTKLKPELLSVITQRAEWTLWVDADCWLDPPDHLPDGNFDVGIIDNIHPEHKARISACFILFHRTRGTVRLIRDWLRRCNYSSRDHAALLYALSLKQADVENITPWLEGRHSYNSLLPESDGWRPNRGVYFG